VTQDSEDTLCRAVQQEILENVGEGNFKRYGASTEILENVGDGNFKRINGASTNDNDVIVEQHAKQPNKPNINHNDAKNPNGGIDSQLSGSASSLSDLSGPSPSASSTSYFNQLLPHIAVEMCGFVLRILVLVFVVGKLLLCFCPEIETWHERIGEED
jgi:hypothetical protein